MRSENGSSGARNQTYEKLAAGLGWFSIGLGAAELIAPGSLSKLIGVTPRSSSKAVLRFYGARELAAGIGILCQPEPLGWLWGRVAGDVLDLSALGAAFASPETDKTKLALATVAVAGVTALDVICAKQLSEESESSVPIQGSMSAVHVRKSMIISRPPEEVYGMYRELRNHSRLSPHLQSVEVLDYKRSHWISQTPGGKTVEWTAEITADEPNGHLAWKTVPGSDIDSAGDVWFVRAPGNRGTIVRVDFSYKPPLGIVGAAIAKLVKEVAPGKQVEDALRRMKQLMETGEIVKSEASVHIGMHPGQPPENAQAATA